MRISKLLSIPILLSALLLNLSCKNAIAYPAESRAFAADSADDIAALVADSSYNEALSVSGVNVFTQQISCGYAVLQMLGGFAGKDISEESLFEQNNHTVTTALGSGFLDECQKQFPEWKATKAAGLSNTEYLKTIHDCLKRGFPVPFEFAAKDVEENWTLHFALITGMNLLEDKITIANPYGYMENYSAEDFLKATRYECYENMEWYFAAGFSMGIFHKNTLYILENKKGGE
ncbi:MAG: hypothetical protein J6J00_03765 [Treponema sp.]|nr:hypothetical protein [Treponema sp.]